MPALDTEEHDSVKHQDRSPVTVRSVVETLVRAPMTKTILLAPFSKRALSELAFTLAGSFFAGVGFAVVAATMGVGIGLAITFIGLAVFCVAIRCARGVARLHRNLARGLLDEVIAEPDPFAARPGMLGWMQSTLRDRVGWRSVAYIALKVPMSVAYVYFGVSLWWDAFVCITYPWNHGSPPVRPGEFGVVRNLFAPGFVSLSNGGFLRDLGVLLTGLVLLLLAPWAVRLLVSIDKMLMRSLLGPDPLSARVRSLERARAQTVDASAATLRRIERDLHDGTQAQLVALAMRLGLAKDKLASDELDVDAVRALVDEAHRGAKEAIVELRDLARGIHPPALDTGLQAALETLAARSTVPTTLSFVLEDRPTPAIETIAYFCVAELLANVAQHAHASRASISCARNGEWLRLVVRDDGVGGAQISRLGSTSSGLAGLVDRVRSVDGSLDIASPPHGPTVVTVDLPMHA
jgi:hypothetical protein